MMNEPTQADHSACAAHNCPLIGSMSSSTNDPDKHWFCFIHHGADPDRWPAITAELNRLGWLSNIAREARQGKSTPEARKAIAMAQRNDLQRGEHELLTTWMVRLENVLRDSCAAQVAA